MSSSRELSHSWHHWSERERESPEIAFNVCKLWLSTSDNNRWRVTTLWAKTTVSSRSHCSLLNTCCSLRIRSTAASAPNRVGRASQSASRVGRPAVAVGSAAAATQQIPRLNSDRRTARPISGQRSGLAPFQWLAFEWLLEYESWVCFHVLTIVNDSQTQHEFQPVLRSVAEQKRWSARAHLNARPDLVSRAQRLHEFP